MVGRLEGQILNKAAQSAVTEVLLYGTPLGVFLGAVAALRSLGLTPQKDLGARIERTLMVPVDGRFPIPQYSGKGVPLVSLPWMVSNAATGFLTSTATAVGQETGWTSYQRADQQIASNLVNERAELLKQKGASSHVAALDAGQVVTLAAIKANRAANRLFDQKGEPNFNEARPDFLIGWISAVGEYAAAIAEFGYVPVQFVVTRDNRIPPRDEKRLNVVAGLRATPQASLPYPGGVVQLLEALSIDPYTFRTSFTPLATSQETQVIPAIDIFGLQGPTQQQVQQIVQPIAGPLEQIAALTPESLFNQLTAPLVAGQESSTNPGATAAPASGSTGAGANRSIGSPVLVLISLAAVLFFVSR